jgi:hypothetical protein
MGLEVAKPLTRQKSESGFTPQPRKMQFLKFDDPRMPEDKLI